MEGRLNMRSMSLRILFAAVCLALSTAGMACPNIRQPPFSEVLAKANSAAIIRIESIRLLPQPYKNISFVPDLAAHVRVAETIFGNPAHVEEILFSGDWCGGHNLDVGKYYLLLLRDDTATVTLEPSEESIVYLFGQYSELPGNKDSSSELLMYMRNHIRGEGLPASFPIQSYLDHNRVSGE